MQLLMVDKIVSQNDRLAGVITTVDALHAPSLIQWTPEMPQQVAVADVLVATKLDLAGPDGEAALEPRLRDINPAAPLVDGRDLPALVGHMQAAAGKDASAAVTGRVLGDAGQPLAGVEVEVLREIYRPGGVTPVPVAFGPIELVDAEQTMSGASSGTYRIGGLPPGEYHLRAYVTETARPTLDGGSRAHAPTYLPGVVAFANS